MTDEITQETSIDDTSEKLPDDIVVPEEIPAEQGKVGYKNPPKEYQWKPGQSGNPLGRRAEGESLKEYQARKYRKMPDEEKDKVLAEMNEIDKWKMAEGNPDQKNNIHAQIIINVEPEIADQNEINVDTIPENNSEGQEQI